MEKKPRWTAADVKEFCGWDFLQELHAKAQTKRDKALVIAAFLTGGRISEVLQLRRDHFILDHDEEFIIVRTMPRVKGFQKIRDMTKWKCESHCKMRWEFPPTEELLTKHGKILQYTGWLTKPFKEYRTFPINRKEPLIPGLLTYLDQLPGPDARLFRIKRSRAYDITTTIGEKLNMHVPTHWFRAQRASQLAFEYGFNEHDLVEFFKWKNYQTAFHYASKGYKGLTQKMVRPD